MTFTFKAYNWLLSWVVKRDLVGSDMTIVLVSVYDLFKAIVFLTDKSAYGSISLAALRHTFYGPRYAAIALIIAVILAGTGQWGSGLSRGQRFLFLCPQLMLLIIPYLSAIYHISIQSYADGVPRSWTFIASDQGDRIIMPFLYISAMYARVRIITWMRE